MRCISSARKCSYSLEENSVDWFGIGPLDASPISIKITCTTRRQAFLIYSLTVKTVGGSKNDLDEGPNAISEIGVLLMG